MGFWKMNEMVFQRRERNPLCQKLDGGQVRQELRTEHLDLTSWRSVVTLSSGF